MMQQDQARKASIPDPTHHDPEPQKPKSVLVTAGVAAVVAVAASLLFGGATTDELTAAQKTAMTTAHEAVAVYALERVADPRAAFAAMGAPENEIQVLQADIGAGLAAACWVPVRDHKDVDGDVVSIQSGSQRVDVTLGADWTRVPMAVYGERVTITGVTDGDPPHGITLDLQSGGPRAFWMQPGQSVSAPVSCE